MGSFYLYCIRGFNLPFIGTATFLHIILNGYYFIEAPPLIFTLAKIYGDSSLYQNDIITTHSFKSFLIPLFSLLDKLNILEPSVFILYSLSIFAVFATVFKLAKLVCIQRLSPYLVILFLLIDKPVLGGINTLEPFFTYRIAATPLMLISLYFILQKRYLLPIILLGFSAYMHILSIIPAFIFLSFMIILECKLNRRNIIYLLILSLVFTPVIIWILTYMVNHPKPAFITNNWLYAIKIRSAHHFFPITNKAGFNSIIIFISAVLVFFNFYINNNEFKKKIYFLSILMILLCVLNFLVINFIPLTLLMQLQLYRSAFYFILFSMFFLADYLVEINKSNNWPRRIIAIGIIVSISGNFLHLFLVFFLIALAQHIFNKKPLPIVRSVMNILVLAILIFFLQNNIASTETQQYGRRQLFGKIDLPENKNYSRWVKLQLWCKYNTFKEELFIIPPHREGFRFYSERGIVGNWKDGTLAIADPIFEKDWLGRMRDLRCLDSSREFGTAEPPIRCKEGFNSLTENDILRLAEKYDAKYIVIDDTKELSFKKLYSDGEFKIYRLQ